MKQYLYPNYIQILYLAYMINCSLSFMNLYNHNGKKKKKNLVTIKRTKNWYQNKYLFSSLEKSLCFTTTMTSLKTQITFGIGEDTLPIPKKLSFQTRPCRWQLYGKIYPHFLICHMYVAISMSVAYTCSLVWRATWNVMLLSPCSCI